MGLMHEAYAQVNTADELQAVRFDDADRLADEALQRRNLRSLNVGQYLHDNAAPREPDDAADDMVMCIEEAERCIAMARRLLAEAGMPGDRNHSANLLAARSLMTEASGFLAEDE